MVVAEVVVVVVMVVAVAVVVVVMVVAVKVEIVLVLAVAVVVAEVVVKVGARSCCTATSMSCSLSVCDEVGAEAMQVIIPAIPPVLPHLKILSPGTCLFESRPSRQITVTVPSLLTDLMTASRNSPVGT